MTILDVKGLEKSFGGVKAIQDLSFSVMGGEILGIAGPNGSGKTTLLDILTGLVPPDRGRVNLEQGSLISRGPGHTISAGIARTFQTARLFSGLTVLENLLVAVSHREEGLSDAIFRRWEAKESTHRDAALQVLEDLGLAEKKNEPANQLSVGQMKRLELGRVLLQEESKLLLFDEPTAGMDLEVIERIIQIIRRLIRPSRGIILVEHNLDVVKQLAHRIIILNQGRVIADGRPTEVFRMPEVVEAYLGNGGPYAA
jgi:ABC-type branched-subunit amino acid transport system ATPase component